MHQRGTPLPGEPGNSVIGDRDGRALGFLGRATGGDLLGVQRADGTSLVYRVTDIEIIDERDVWIMKDEGPTRLTMITCYPFGVQCASHGLRYAVIARALPSGDATPER
jgi:sortase A